MASFSSTYPSQRPVFTLDAANAGRLDSRMTFTRSDTPPTYAAPSAVHYWSNEKHLSSENLIPNSNTNAAWQTFSVTKLVSGSFLDGSDSLKVSETVDTAAHYIAPNVGAGNSTSFVSGTEYTAVMYAKAGTDNIIQVGMSSGLFGVNAYANYDLSNAATPPVTGSAATATITALGSDWVKLTLTATATSSGQTIGMFVAFTENDINASRAPSYAGDTASNVYLWWGNVSSTGQTVLTKTYGAIIREYAPTLKSVATAGQPRFEYDPASDGQSVAKGILIEGSATNLIQQSDSIDNAYWTKQNSTVTAAAAVGVTGELNACLITEIEDVSPATSVHSVYSSAFGLSSATSCTVSLYCKAAGVNRVQLLSTVGGSVRNAIINIANGTVISESSATGAVESVGNGFYRISITYTAPATTNGRVYLNLLNDSGTSDYAGNGYNGVIATGFQFEQNSFPSSLISTSGSAVTRASESLSMTDASIFTSGEHSVYWEGSVNGSTADPRLFALHNNSSTDRVMVDNNDGTKLRLNVKVDSTDFVLSETITAIPDNSKVVATVKANEARLVLNGTTTVTDTSTPISSGYSTLNIGSNYGGTNHLDGHIRRISYWNTALTETQAQALTS